MLISKELTEMFFNFENTVLEPGSLDAKTKELIAVSNSIMVDCGPCLEYHYRRAVDNGATDQEVMEAIAVAIAVSGGSKFGKFASKAAELFSEPT